ncbi:MAG: hypothetical protein Q9208_008435 [Pyrenodesmia sp. 3 TL-2023]
MSASDADGSGEGVKRPRQALMVDATIVITNEEVDVPMDDAVALDDPDAATDVEMVDDDEPDKAFWMTTPGVVVDGDPTTEEVGDGPYKTTFAVRVVDKPHAAIFQKHYKRLPQTQEVLDYHLKQAQVFDVVRTSTVWKSSDGEPLAYFIKEGMSTGLSPDESVALLAESEEATAALQKEYRPKHTPKDSRVADDVKAMKKDMEEKGLKYARIHYSYGKAEGRPHGPGYIRQDARHKLPVVAKFMQQTAWEHRQVSNWIRMIDNSGFWQEAHQRYQSFGQQTLQHLYQGPEACHLGLDVLWNVASGPHRDKEDVPEAWTSTNTWSDYKLGYLVLPEFGVQIDQRPGDLILMHARALIHFVGPTDGNRICHVRYTNKWIFRESQGPPPVDLPCPVDGCARRCASKSIFKKHLKGPTNKEQRAAAMKSGKGKYHFMDENAEVNKLLKEAVDVYEAAAAAKDQESREKEEKEEKELESRRKMSVDFLLG